MSLFKVFFLEKNPWLFNRRVFLNLFLCIFLKVFHMFRQDHQMFLANPIVDDLFSLSHFLNHFLVILLLWQKVLDHIAPFQSLVKLAKLSQFTFPVFSFLIKFLNWIIFKNELNNLFHVSFHILWYVSHILQSSLLQNTAFHLFHLLVKSLHLLCIPSVNLVQFIEFLRFSWERYLSCSNFLFGLLLTISLSLLSLCVKVAIVRVDAFVEFFWNLCTDSFLAWVNHYYI